MDTNELGRLMVRSGACIRAIPSILRVVVEPRHINDYPNGKIIYLPEYKREMLVAEYVPKHEGQFLVKICHHTNARVDFNGLKFYDTLEDAATVIAEKPTEKKLQTKELCFGICTNTRRVYETGN